MNTKVRSVVVKDQVWEKLRKVAELEGRSMSDLLREALNDLFVKRRLGDYDPVTDRFTSNIK